MNALMILWTCVHWSYQFKDKKTKDHLENGETVVKLWSIFVKGWISEEGFDINFYIFEWNQINMWFYIDIVMPFFQVFIANIEYNKYYIL